MNTMLTDRYNEINLSGYDRKYFQSYSETQREYQKTENAFSEKWERLFGDESKHSEKAEEITNLQKESVSRTGEIVENVRTEILFEKVVQDIQNILTSDRKASDGTQKTLITALEESLEGENNRSIAYHDVFETVSRIENIMKEKSQADSRHTESIPLPKSEEEVFHKNDDTTAPSQTNPPENAEMLSVREKIVIVNKAVSNRTYTYNEKIRVLQKILDSHISEDEDFNRHIRNKIRLLTKVRDSGFVIQLLPPKNKKVRQSADNKTALPKDEKARKRAENLTVLTKTIEQYRTKEKKILEIAHSRLLSADDKVSMIMEMELAQENSVSQKKNLPTENMVQILEKRTTVTKQTVQCKEYFKFGAGKSASFGEFILILPSAYSVSETLCDNCYVIAASNVIQQNKEENLITSPLVIKISRSQQKLCDSYHEFFSSNIHYCLQHNIRYRQSTVSGFPCVFKHKSGENQYIISVYNTKRHYITDICFDFHVRCDNKDGIVKRILSQMTVMRQ